MFLCKHTYESDEEATWEGSWELIHADQNQSELRVKGRGSSFHVILGFYASGAFLCIPEINIGCPLSHWEDTFWNFERLSAIMNETDAKTIVNALRDYSVYY